MKSCDMEGISCWRGICQLRLWSVGRHGKTNFYTIPAHLFAHKTLVTSCHYDFEKPLPFLQPLTLDQFFQHPPIPLRSFFAHWKTVKFYNKHFFVGCCCQIIVDDCDCVLCCSFYYQVRTGSSLLGGWYPHLLLLFASPFLALFFMWMVL